MIDPTNKFQILGNRYRLIHQVGKGGMASVYEAYDITLERPVAVKLLRQDFSEVQGFRERFRQEGKSAANLSHPNIVTVHDFGIDPLGIFIVMEYVAGKDLKARIIEKGRYTVPEGLPLALQACQALGYAHRAGLVHCDVKPQNMIVSEDRRLKITDFGIARALATIDQDEIADVVWGSPQYLSPEQAAGEPPSPASDVYSLGVVLYEMFTGKLPFESETTEGLKAKHQNEIPVPPSHWVVGFPKELEQIILKVLSKEPSARYRTADQLASVLVTFFDHLQPVSKAGTVASARPPALKSLEPTNQVTYEDYSPKTDRDSSIDWKLIGFELLCLLLVGGLLPFWLYIWFSLKPLFN